MAFTAKMSLTGDPGEGQSSVSGRHTGERVLRNAGDRRAMGKRSGGGNALLIVNSMELKSPLR